MEVRFASPMNLATVMPNTAIIPDPTGVYTYRNEYETSLYLSFDLQPSTAYTVTLGAGMADPYGNTLGENYDLHFATRALDPMAYLNSLSTVGTYNAYTETVVYATYRNVSRLEFALYHLSVEDFISLTGRRWEKFRPDPEALVRRWSEEVEAPPNQAHFLGTKVAGEEGGLEPGIYFLGGQRP